MEWSRPRVLIFFWMNFQLHEIPKKGKKISWSCSCLVIYKNTIDWLLLWGDSSALTCKILHFVELLSQYQKNYSKLTNVWVSVKINCQNVYCANTSRIFCFRLPIFIRFTNIQFRESTPLQERTFLKNRNKLLGRSLQNGKQLLNIFFGYPRWRIKTP